ncbi:MAG: FliH/SctL family protein [Thermodesulfobacteriota bacterium]|nr:FliH/SctL family protein [Thermodesulfobacteriota bacterium]
MFKQTSENDVFWTKFEMESFESPYSPDEKDKTEFISLQMCGKEEEETDFVPFRHGSDNREKRKEAENILQEARKKIDLIEQEAYEKGFSQGEKDGLELGEKKAIKVVEKIENILIEINQLKNDFIEHYEKEILELIFSISKKVTHRQINLDAKAIEGTVLDALHLASDKSNILFRINPEDFDTIEKLRPEFLARFKELKSIVVTSDPSVTRGGCFLETPYGDIDASIETQLEKIHQSLEEAYNTGT